MFYIEIGLLSESQLEGHHVYHIRLRTSGCDAVSRGLCLNRHQFITLHSFTGVSS